MYRPGESRRVRVRARLGCGARARVRVRVRVGFGARLKHVQAERVADDSERAVG